MLCYVVMHSLTPELTELVAERFRALGEPMRLRLLNALRGGELGVSELVEETGATQANVSKHLQVLHRLGFVQRRKEGTAAFYSLADPDVFKLCDLVCGGARARVKDQQRILQTSPTGRRTGG
jgi:ArsR family transcriptional regulator